MKFKIWVAFHAVLGLLLLASYQANAQGNFSGGGGMGESQRGQSQGPYIGAGPYNPFMHLVPPPSPQGFYGSSKDQVYPRYPHYPPTMMRPGKLPTEGLNSQELQRRRCDLAVSVPAPFPPSVPRTPQRNAESVEVRGPWPGSPGNSETFQRSVPRGGFANQRNLEGIAGIGLMYGSDRQQRGGINDLQDQRGTEKSPANESRERDAQTMVPPAPEGFLYEPISTIEATFMEVPIFNAGEAPYLRQYGYSLFASPISTFAPVEDVPVGPDYILGPGDDLVLNIWGAMESRVILTVDRNGEVSLPSVGPLRIWGLPFSQADEIIRDQLLRYYKGFKASVTMGRLRTIRVYVVGEVCQPGAFTLSSLSTVTNALFAAGGPLKLGSLRQIELKRNGITIGTVDLYDFLLRGDKSRDFRLQSGDTIFVPSIGPNVAVAGQIMRPAIYELAGPTSLTDFIKMAGGLTPRSNLKRVQVIRAKPNSGRQIIDLDLSSSNGNGYGSSEVFLVSGDFINIYPTDPRIYNTVRIEGAVKYPGEYELKSDMRLGDLLPKDNLLPEAYSDRVEIARLKEDLTTEIISAKLSKAWEGDEAQNIRLQRMDLISVRSDFKAPGTVILEGEVVRPGLYRIKAGEHLSSVLRRAGGFTDKAFLKGAVFTRRSVEAVERKKMDDFMHQQEQALLADSSQKSLLPERREQLMLLASKVTLGRVVVRLDNVDDLDGSNNDIVLEDDDSLKVPQKPSTVLVLGSVRNPTAVLHLEDKDVQYYLNRAGGLAPQAAQKEIYLVKADGSAIAGFLKLRDIEPGDVIITPPDTSIKTDKLDLMKSLATIAGQIAITMASLVTIFF